MLTIYGIPTLNTTKVLLTAEELALDYKLVLLNFQQGDHKTAEHIKRHPLGKAPAIEDDGQFLYESNTICRYLAAKENSSLYSGDARSKALIDQWVDLMTQHLGKWMAVFFFEEFVRPNFLDKPARSEELKEAQGFLDEQVTIMEKQLAENTFLLGDHITIADTIAISFVQTHEQTSLSLDKYTNLMNWYNAFKERGSYKKVMSKYPN